MRSLVPDDDRTKPFDNLTTLFIRSCVAFFWQQLPFPLGMPQGLLVNENYKRFREGLLRQSTTHDSRFHAIWPEVRLGVEQGESYACLKHRRALAKEEDRCSVC